MFDHFGRYNRIELALAFSLQKRERVIVHSEVIKRHGWMGLARDPDTLAINFNADDVVAGACQLPAEVTVTAPEIEHTTGADALEKLQHCGRDISAGGRALC